MASYPEITTSVGFRSLQTQLWDSEKQISDVRHNFSDAVQGYNTVIHSVPENYVANFRGFKEMPNFEAESKEQQSPKTFF